ncbi:MAG TPA: hypothetical protein VEB18_04030 [Candidatus Paceibacterota bacterium]|nr:hypothetical protein [Candidatus Paceibacterota bacterium]
MLKAVVRTSRRFLGMLHNWRITVLWVFMTLQIGGCFLLSGDMVIGTLANQHGLPEWAYHATRPDWINIALGGSSAVVGALLAGCLMYISTKERSDA